MLERDTVDQSSDEQRYIEMLNAGDPYQKSEALENCFKLGCMAALGVPVVCGMVDYALRMTSLDNKGVIELVMDFIQNLP
ncbi:hypothetical protein A2715_06200 [Candidatus Woesebacteria bacterium RIFCSPHIGHO2_01_FULL_39_32]|uniref:Uncharacterized protein n=2 Tax=Candidatus Woeseibacteriota TaxID=1752722 RepID=A0A0G0SUP6_9BACT|nr:MAG: hypothetical protein UT61_C0033G0004 [Candidatus Woesebacteria bacterium GW2011_GWA1_39_8]OGM24559.1 MAG: hypothetical protein A2715_06200 [Candidatus Woesebacteria bacterium RIFCSPHIGHO2_01_FULL_39_32]OGM37049.1 MAG: hypothetical protein A3F01_01055 [Candidatus Woesebacteria bacterium RIFCSPHIGHO2_12_FULL_38_11]OGM65493.1 MAG: hypothetical protein A2893_01750 [Candidatus Woesebacteria bacterium RIFCSPLOWO2_01_FULL_39_25]